jgi:hypothetical protein
MAEMSRGCTACHHKTPAATTLPATSIAKRPKNQADAEKVPACKSCHAISLEAADILMPNLKGAYHRQCLNCHREWAHANDCVICHRPRNQTATTIPATVDDIVGRMHPPIAAPVTKTYTARFTPVAGVNVLFRHKEHTQTFDLKCANCHFRDTCGDCHGAKGEVLGAKPLRPGKTWSDSHSPCVNCHANDRCGHCHFSEAQTAPAAFTHAATGQMLDKDHAAIICGKCHLDIKRHDGITCDGAGCHKRKITFPTSRPGVVVTTQPAVIATTQPWRAAKRPATTRAVIVKIRS